MKPVNLNKFRKQKARADKKARADENAVTYGLSKSEKARLETQNARAISFIEGHKTDGSDDEPVT